MQSERNQQKNDEKITREYKRRRNRQLIVSIITVAAIIYINNYWAGSNTFSRGQYVLALIAMILFGAGALVFSLLNWRCPVCNKWLGGRFWPKALCRKCGTHFR